MRAATTNDGKSPQDWKREATAPWKRFVYCIEHLPHEQAAPLWQQFRLTLDLRPQTDFL